MKENRKFIHGIIAGILIAIMVGGAGCLIWKNVDRGAKESVTNKENLDKLEYIQSLIDNYYLNDVEESELEEGMYAGILEGLDDPYSRYYTAEEYEETTAEIEGHYDGIGVVMQQGSDGIVTLVRVYEGAPADKAGILAGDILYKVDGEEVTGMELSLVAKKIKGSPSKVTNLTLVREGEDDYLEMEVTKEDVQIPMTSYEMLDNQVGYLAIYEFTSVSFQQYEAAMADLREQGMKSLVIDLRNNPGGLLDSVCDILNTILPEGTIVYTEDKYGNRAEKTSEGKTPLDIPLAVLVNGSSASASEIFAGAVKDYDMGTVVGTTTFGKGVVQTVKQLSDGSAVKLTVSNYFTPSGVNINGTGITPDVEVELDEALRQKNTITKEEDNQLQKAIETLSRP